MRRSILALATLACLVAPVGSAGTTHDVAIVNFIYDPAVIQIAAGDTVVWTNFDAFLHTVTDVPLGTYNSGDMPQGWTFAHTYTEPGVYAYWCLNHPFMVGAVVVR